MARDAVALQLTLRVAKGSDPSKRTVDDDIPSHSTDAAATQSTVLLEKYSSKLSLL